MTRLSPFYKEAKGFVSIFESCLLKRFSIYPTVCPKKRAAAGKSAPEGQAVSAAQRNGPVKQLFYGDGFP